MSDKLEKKIAQLKGGDGRAFDYVYEKTNRPVYFAILYIVRDKMYAEDIMQDTYIKAMSSLGQYAEGTNFTAWICTIAKSLALNHLKKYRREISTDFDAESFRYGQTETHTPFIFDVAAKVLDEDEYKILMLCQVAGYKRREVAEMMKIPIGTVTWKNNQSLRKLKEYLIKEGRE